ncbi:MAG: ThiF family adenylyltransferase [Mycobacteriales bacterium]
MDFPGADAASAGKLVPFRTPASCEVPVRPVLKTALHRLWRDASCVQLGLDAQRAVVLEDVSASAGTVLELLDGTLEWADLVAAAADRGCDPAEATALLQTLLAGGLLEDAAAVPSGLPVDELDRLAPDFAHESLLASKPGAAAQTLVRRRATRIVIVGAGRVGSAIARLLAAAGAGVVTVCDPRPAVASDAGPAGFPVPRDGRTRAFATAAAGARSRGLRLQPTRLVCDDPRLYTDVALAILAPDVYAGPAPGLAAALAATRTPYLLAAVRETRGIVGPLVLPGVTSCPRCHDLIRADTDPAWPLLAAQLSVGRPGVVPACDVVLATLVAAVAVGQVQDHIAGRQVAALSATLEIPLPQWRLVRRPWRTHPACGCTTAAAS